MYEILKEININPGINQRGLSRQCNVSLGKINSLMDELEDNNLVTKEQDGRAYRYYITKDGLTYLEDKLKLDKNTFLELHTNNKIKPNLAVVLAAGRNKEFDEPTALLEINGVKLINRTVNQLRENGIERIVVVAGYKAQELKMELDSEIIVVENPKYKWTGTMYSLNCAAPYIDGDFILIESDIVVESSGIEQLINNENRDCILITTESGSGDEALVEIDGDSIFKISKDIAQLNRIDGEMIGISKVSYEFFNKMVEAFKNNKNPYMNYEYMILDISRNYSLGFEKIDNLLWHEIDTKAHFVFVQDKLLKRIEKKEESIKYANLKEIAATVMDIDIARIDGIAPIGGMTNKNYKVNVGDEAFVLRVPGNGTESMISREDEFDNAKYATEIGVDAELIYFNKDTGIKVSRFIENAETLTDEASKNEVNMKMVCDILRTLHNCKNPMKNTFDIYEKIENYEELLNQTGHSNYDDYESVKEKVMYTKNIMAELNAKHTPCHNDTLAANFIKSGDDKMYLIDWEYGGMNDPMWDIAAHCLENDFSEDEEELFLNIYFEGKPEEGFIKRILINKIYQDFLWSIWTKVKEANGDDFGTYGIDRYNRAKKNLDILLNN